MTMPKQAVAVPPAHPAAARLTKAQIGKCGELLVQYRLLLLGIESSPMATDRGIDLVAFAATQKRALTIQVKSNLQAKPGGGKGKLALDWWVPATCPADFVALVDLSSERVWVLTCPELEAHAQQKPDRRWHIYMYTDASHQPKKAGRLAHAHEFDGFLLERRAATLFD